MIHVHTAPLLHYAGDAAAWMSAWLGGRWVHARRRAAVETLARQTAPNYFIALALGAVAGAWTAGSLNMLRAGIFAPSHSVAGALAGGIIAVEIWKWINGVRGSTGGPFVIPLTLGIVVGRWGCLFAGLPDQTYGIATTLPWGVDLGDGIARHPVQIYESLAMAAFLGIYWPALTRGRLWATTRGFHYFVLAYAVQRFAWEFLKPYALVAGPLNLFHLLMIGLALYASYWIATGRNGNRSAAKSGPLHLPRTDDEPV